MSLDNLATLFHDELRDVLSAEKQLLKALPKMAKSATCEKLKSAFNNHLAQTADHIQRTTDAFEETGKVAKAKTCEAMKGLLKEADEILKMNGEPAVKDAILIAAAQKVEHYEIATYGTLCTWAKLLGYTRALDLLKQNLSDEEAADKHLTVLAQAINREVLAI